MSNATSSSLWAWEQILMGILSMDCPQPTQGLTADEMLEVIPKKIGMVEKFQYSTRMCEAWLKSDVHLNDVERIEIEKIIVSAKYHLDTVKQHLLVLYNAQAKNFHAANVNVVTMRSRL